MTSYHVTNIQKKLALMFFLNFIVYRKRINWEFTCNKSNRTKVPKDPTIWKNMQENVKTKISFQNRAYDLHFAFWNLG